jgi:carbon-monoxide dehydrogenase medium subunit
MKLLKPKTISETLKMREDFPGEARILAGGTDLVPRINRRDLRPKVLVSIKGVQGLQFIQEVDGGLRIGPLVTHADLAADPLVRKRYPSLALASAQVGSPLIRNLGTLGGNLCWASPAADTAPPLLCLGAEIIWREGDQEHQEPLEHFFKGVNQTSLSKTALVTGIFIPPQPLEYKSVFLKLGLRNSVTTAVVSVAATAAFEGEDRANRFKIALGSVGSVPLLAKKAVEYLTGKSLDPEVINEAADLAAQEASPISDIRASAWYRTEMIRVFTRRALSTLLGIEER